MSGKPVPSGTVAATMCEPQVPHRVCAAARDRNDMVETNILPINWFVADATQSLVANDNSGAINLLNNCGRQLGATTVVMKRSIFRMTLPSEPVALPYLGCCFWMSSSPTPRIKCNSFRLFAAYTFAFLLEYLRVSTIPFARSLLGPLMFAVVADIVVNLQASPTSTIQSVFVVSIAAKCVTWLQYHTARTCFVAGWIRQSERRFSARQAELARGTIAGNSRLVWLKGYNRSFYLTSTAANRDWSDRFRDGRSFSIGYLVSVSVTRPARIVQAVAVRLVLAESTQRLLLLAGATRLHERSLRYSSMMRRTNSGTRMPSRSASVVRNAYWGAVNDNMTLSIGQLYHGIQPVCQV